MKLALDSMLKFQPEGDICVIGILIRDPRRGYVMHKFAAAYTVPDTMSTFPLVHLMQIFEHTKAKVQRTVDRLRRVKIYASPTPKVPLS
ncbi:hypothetical protein BGZ88_006545 [Linnemannia elongata]|nr:hypothetical protein BGZ88_006545 [Linnemannia elongata]